MEEKGGGVKSKGKELKTHGAIYMLGEVDHTASAAVLLPEKFRRRPEGPGRVYRAMGIFRRLPVPGRTYHLCIFEVYPYMGGTAKDR